MVHQCNECDSSFREKKNLQQHMRKRHGLKRYKCSYCNDRFDNRTSLGRHEKQKHGNELFQCKQCEYSSPRKDRLRQHIRSKHKEKNIRCRTPSKIHWFFSFYIESFKSLVDKEVNIGQKAHDFPWSYKQLLEMNELRNCSTFMWVGPHTGVYTVRAPLSLKTFK